MRESALEVVFDRLSIRTEQQHEGVHDRVWEESLWPQPFAFTALPALIQIKFCLHSYLLFEVQQPVFFSLSPD